MSHFVVNLNEPEREEEKAEKPEKAEKAAAAPRTPLSAAAAAPVRRKGRARRLLTIAALGFGALALVVGIVAYFYWQSVKYTPEYSLALLVEAARTDDQATIDQLVDTDAVVESFLPQVTDKATELYGRNLPPDKIARVKEFSTPLLPAIKQRARQEVPRVIDEKTDRFAHVPYWAIALGAGYFLDVATTGETAVVTSRIPGRQFELTMKRNGDRWRIVGLRDDALARRIAETVGQEIIAVSTKEGLKKVGDKMNAPGLENIKKKFEELFR